ncbi:ATP-binding cassette domain-containing protein [Streptomyces sp. NE06-03E]|uniref:ATP-binding cassette domain-containing protein n=1 Tax=Streptomyces silvae TaxID=2803812 RepID=A0ABU8A2Y8_9ACTN|nr:MULTISPECIES: ATP-binding cassette domain-containing protein [unclassified Streptomyces]WSS66504.1 ATP-binding cassette domain-containing protein [Streptomyces sp. NBC_01177]WSS73453.1 ATP-binding cassette domain-containing protein [Streptomyces sp. NBC_01175]WSS80994.1 ATP-binding cassette domain-containing protein [Streptomyces sp. NBC_01174]MDX3058285.1 ATP-binding cassette domain-containing protein [Streptomyces sp. NE06-03E]MDX3327847.1 ATP-binding cassette domain-containing protein [S
MSDAIVVEGVHKRYGDKRALDGLDLTVRGGTVHGVLGPNGAGKTTAVRVLTTLLRHDEGRAEVAGFDVRSEAAEVRRRIGLLGQHAALDEELGGRQNLEMFGRLHHLGARRAGVRAGELLERFGLTDTGRKAVARYSGGMRRRLDLAASLITDPEVLFLDEPTTGLDPRGRAEVWSSVRSLASGGTTILLTTQYLEEADQLADRISVVDGGRVIAEGTADELKAMVGGDRVDVVVRDAGRLGEAAALLGEGVTVDVDRRLLGAPAPDRMGTLTRTVRALEEAGIEAEDIAVRRPTLDEVFLALTGQAGGPRTSLETEVAA